MEEVLAEISKLEKMLKELRKLLKKSGEEFACNPPLNRL